MIAWRSLLGTAVLLTVAGSARTQTYTLAEPVKTGDCFRLQLAMDLSGEMRVTKDGALVPLKLTAAASHEFDQKVLAVGSSGQVDKAARVYKSAKATISVNGDPSERALSPSYQLVVAQRIKDQNVIYSPVGQFTRDQLELVGEHFDTLALTGLLPGTPVAVGETWKVSNSVAQALCNFEGLTEQGLTCKLEGVKDNVASVSVSGIANGIDLGAQAKLTIEAAYRFDLGSKRLAYLEWKQKDERDQGPASPATSLQSTTTLKRSAIDEPASLADEALLVVPDGPPPPHLLQLAYLDAKGRFELIYDREWQTVGQTDDHLVMRLIERGDFISQVTITPWKPAGKGQHLTREEVAEAMSDIPGWDADMELQAGEVPSDEPGRWVYRISATGQMDGAPVIQNFYLVAGPEGDQVVLLFTMTPKQAERLGSRDLALVGSISLPAKK